MHGDANCCWSPKAGWQRQQVGMVWRGAEPQLSTNKSVLFVKGTELNNGFVIGFLSFSAVGRNAAFVSWYYFSEIDVLLFHLSCQFGFHSGALCFPCTPASPRWGKKLGYTRNRGSGAGSQTCKVIPRIIKICAHPSEGQEKKKKACKQYLGHIQWCSEPRLCRSDSVNQLNLLGDVFSFPGKLLLKHNSHWLFLKGLSSVCSAGFWTGRASPSPVLRPHPLLLLL